MAEFSNLGAFLRQKRIDSGLTQAELASKVGDVHTQFVSNWERGLCAPPGHSLQRIIDILKLNRDHLIGVMLEDSRVEIMSKIYKKRMRSGRKQA
jgi:transcriptional regulator with XRE-family HTH domain